ncbi:hypothetical protein [Synechococcus sp. PCC 7336]|nr:hypothetical protein [Synechococcus sp. PCC 7336]
MKLGNCCCGEPSSAIGSVGADAEAQRAEQLAAQLRAAGIEPEV